MLHSFYHEASPWSLCVGKQWQWNDKMTWTFFFRLLKIVWHMESPSTCSFSPKCGTYKSRNLPTFVWKFQSAFSDIHTDFHLTQLYRKSLHLELSLIQLKTVLWDKFLLLYLLFSSLPTQLTRFLSPPKVTHFPLTFLRNKHHSYTITFLLLNPKGNFLLSPDTALALGCC